jgi:hypothetical protein
MTNLGDMVGDQREDGLVNPKRSGINGCQDEKERTLRKKKNEGRKKDPSRSLVQYIRITVSQNRVV